MQYRRHYHKGASYLFTINLADRSSALLIEQIDVLRHAFKRLNKDTSFILMLLSFIRSFAYAMDNAKR